MLLSLGKYELGQHLWAGALWHDTVWHDTNEASCLSIENGHRCNVDLMPKGSLVWVLCQNGSRIVSQVCCEKEGCGNMDWAVQRTKDY